MRTRLIQKAKRAFTLIEILIVVVILGILAAIVIPQFAESADSAQHSAAKSTLQTVRSQFELCKFRLDCDCDGPIADIITDLTSNGYLQSAPNMPANYALAFDGASCRIVATGPVLNAGQANEDDPADW